MALTDQELKLIEEANNRRALLAPFKRITDQWSVQTTHKFQNRIRDIDLVASDDLSDDWNVRVIAGDTGIVVAEFSFNEYGRFFDMRRIPSSNPPPIAQIEAWVRNKVETGRIRFSTLAEKRGLSFSDPRVIHDITYRLAKSGNFRPSRRRWYNKGKEASINDLYDQLREAMADAVLAGTKAGLQTSVAVS